MNGLLFIDDEEGIRRSISRALKRSPYEVFLAKTGDEGVKWLENNPGKVSTVVSDYKMPGLNGLETLTIVGRIDPEITRIILTGYATMNAAIEATNEGIDGFLTKPFDNADLKSKINDISLRKRLKQFVPEAVYKKIKKHPDALSPTYHEVSILFCDIRGFTRMSDGAQPEEIADFLNNHFFSPMGEIAYRFNGAIDKHMGDSLMVVFGALSAHSKDAENAVQAALSMQEKASEIDEILRSRNGFRMTIGIGISTGEVYSGILGSFRKKEFTSIGMPVNIAARLQKLAGAGEILISDRTFAVLSKPIEDPDGTINDLSVDKLPPTRIKGIETPLTVYKVKKMAPRGA